MIFGTPDSLFAIELEDIKVEWGICKEDLDLEPDFWGKLELLFGFFSKVLLLAFQLLSKAIAAAILGILNAFIWVVIVFSTAAPMIFSGLYEASIDRQVLRAIEKEVGKLKDTPGIADKDKGVKHQVHLLYAILVGNLELQQPKSSGEGGAGTAASEETHKKTTDNMPSGLSAAEIKAAGRAWHDVDHLVREFDHKEEHAKNRMGRRLLTMLGCQASFGASIGAPIAFYLGSFLFSVFGNHENLGSADTSLALAFGEWWMTIPHVAIVSGCLLAGNNPNTLEVIGNTEVAPKSTDRKGFWQSIKDTYTPFYDSVYQPVWMWERGRSKRNW